MENELKNLYLHKTSRQYCTPAKIINENVEIFSQFLVKLK